MARHPVQLYHGYLTSQGTNLFLLVHVKIKLVIKIISILTTIILFLSMQK